VIQQAFAVFDSKAKVFFVPFFCPSVAVATRAFGTAANDPQTQISKYPEDFTLFQIGEFNDEDGSLRPFPQHINLGLAAQYVREVSL